jgi:hypothetical protein
MSRPDPVALLANEMGAGRGHVVSLSRIARALGPDVGKIAAVASLRHAGELSVTGATVHHSPRLSPSPETRANPALRGNATWGCYLADSGLMRADVLERNLAFWRHLIVTQNVSVLVADFAPLALCAAHGLRQEGWEIRIITAGTGYGIPPAGLSPLPRLTPGFNRLIHPEGAVLASLNQGMAAQGWAPFPCLSAIWQADLSLIGTFDFLDPYAGLRPAGTLVPPLVERSANLAQGDEVFVYFSRQEPEIPALTDALCALPLPRRGYLPGTSDVVKARLAASGMVIESSPVPADQIAARSRLMIHPSPHGSLCTAALAGLLQIGLPGHKEQMTHARRAEAAGVLKVLSLTRSGAADLLAGIMGHYHDPNARARARELAMALRATFPADPAAALAARLAPEVAAARAFLTT